MCHELVAKQLLFDLFTPLCSVETVAKCRLTGPVEEHSCVSRGALGTGLEIFGLACFLLFINLFGI